MSIKQLSLTATGAVVFAFSFAGAGYAGTVVGNNTDGNCYPFSCGPSDSVTIYQQVYNSTAFANPISISSINFFKDSGGQMDSATYKVSLSTTLKSVLGLDNNYLNNIGVDNVEFGTFNIGGAMPDVLNLAGNSFNYNPTAGNLLMTVEVLNPTNILGGYNSFFQSDASGSATSRLFTNLSGTTSNGTSALVTEFNTTAIPTPALLPGLIGLGVAALRKRKAEAAEQANEV